MELYVQQFNADSGKLRWSRQMMAAFLFSVTIAAVAFVLVERGGQAATVCALALVSSHVIAMGWLLQDDIFNPLSGVWLSLFIGTGLRSVYLALSDSDRVPTMMWQLEFDDLAIGANIATLAAVSIVTGYMISSRLSLPIRSKRLVALRHDRLIWFTLFALTCAFIAAVDFFRQTGFDLSVGLSAKRRFATDGENVQAFAALGYHRWFACIVPSVLFYFWSWEFVRSRSRVAGSFAFTCFMFAAGFAFLASSRTVICALLLNFLYILHSFGYLRFIHVMLVAAAVVVILSVMLGLRQFSTRKTSEVKVSNTLAPEAAIDAVLGNENFADLGRTSLIYRSVPNVFSYRYGMSYISWLFAPVPRAQWKDKPVLSQGLEVSEVIYGARRSAKGIEGGGRPPTFIGEVIMNFGLFGIPVCGLIYGIGLRLFHNFHSADSRSNVLLSTSILLPISFGFMGGEFSMALIEVMQALLPAMILLWWTGLSFSGFGHFSFEGMNEEG